MVILQWIFTLDCPWFSRTNVYMCNSCAARVHGALIVHTFTCCSWNLRTYPRSPLNNKRPFAWICLKIAYPGTPNSMVYLHFSHKKVPLMATSYPSFSDTPAKKRCSPTWSDMPQGSHKTEVTQYRNTLTKWLGYSASDSPLSKQINMLLLSENSYGSSSLPLRMGNLSRSVPIFSKPHLGSKWHFWEPHLQTPSRTWSIAKGYWGTIYHLVMTT